MITYLVTSVVEGEVAKRTVVSGDHCDEYKSIKDTITDVVNSTRPLFEESDSEDHGTEDWKELVANRNKAIDEVILTLKQRTAVPKLEEWAVSPPVWTGYSYSETKIVLEHVEFRQA